MVEYVEDLSSSTTFTDSEGEHHHPCKIVYDATINISDIPEAIDKLAVKSLYNVYMHTHKAFRLHLENVGIAVERIVNKFIHEYKHFAHTPTEKFTSKILEIIYEDVYEIAIDPFHESNYSRITELTLDVIDNNEHLEGILRLNIQTGDYTIDITS